MKNIYALLVAVLSIQSINAQLKTTPVCPVFDVDLLEGTINKLDPTATLGEVEKAFPCFTNDLKESTEGKCVSIFYKDKDIYFFPERRYVELGEKFKGKLSIPLFGANRTNLFKILGNPQIKDVNWDAFQTKYGILILYYNQSGKINKIQMSNLGAATLKLCE